MKTFAPALTLVASTLAAPALGADPFLSASEAKGLVGRPGVRLVFADSEREFEKGHLPGSVVAYAHDLYYLDDVKACQGLPMCEARAASFIGALGIDAATDVVVYDLGAGVNASGTWFYLKLYGVKSVRILDGGLASWKAQGGAVETGAPAKVAAKPFAPSVQRDMVATLEEVKRATGDPAHYLLLDARHTLDEFAGKTLQTALASPGREYTVKRGGSIPGAVFSPWSRYAGNKGSEPGKPTLREAGDLAKQLEKLRKNGYAPDKTVISYCQVGLGRGSFQYLALKQAGHEKVKVYVGSWAEWGNDPALPLADQP